MKIASMIVWFGGGLFFTHLAIKENSKEIKAALGMIALYLLFDGIKNIIKHIKQS